MTSLFPMFLKLDGRQCLVVGAGKVGEPKIGGLFETGARIRVVALAASPAVREWARAGRIERRLSGGGCGWAGGGRARHGHGRLNTTAGLVLRGTGHDGQLWAGVALWADCLRIVA